MEATELAAKLGIEPSEMQSDASAGDTGTSNHTGIDGKPDAGQEGAATTQGDGISGGADWMKKWQSEKDKRYALESKHSALEKELAELRGTVTAMRDMGAKPNTNSETPAQAQAREIYEAGLGGQLEELKARQEKLIHNDDFDDDKADLFNEKALTLLERARILNKQKGVDEKLAKFEQATADKEARATMREVMSRFDWSENKRLKDAVEEVLKEDFDIDLKDSSTFKHLDDTKLEKKIRRARTDALRTLGELSGASKKDQKKSSLEDGRQETSPSTTSQKSGPSSFIDATESAKRILREKYGANVY
jgi:hypothetical protein